VSRAPLHEPETASQTAGPYLHIGLMPAAAGRIQGQGLTLPALGAELAAVGVAGERIVIGGRVVDGAGAPVRDMVIEIWQADARGIHASPTDPRHAQVSAGFRGFGRVCTDPDDGTFRIETIKPGPASGTDAPHLNLWLLARGLNSGLSTRLYFDDEDAANATDAVLGLIDPPQRAETLLARRTGPGAYTFDIRLQGEGETVFLDV